MIEGARLLDDAIKENVPLREGFYTSAAENKYPELIYNLKARLHGQAFEISEEVSKKLSDTVNPQGIYAVAERLDKSDKIGKIEDGKYLVLANLQDPGNIGTVLRCADAVGVSGVFLCGGCDLYNPKLIRSTMGSLFRLNIRTAEYFSLISMLNDGGFTTCAAVVDKDAESVRDFVFPDKCAAVIGNEGNGLSEEEKSVCKRRITIKMNGSIESLNAASAASIILWELTKERSE